MTASDGRPLAATLVAALVDAAVAVDADDRVLAWNAAAETQLALTPTYAGQTLAEVRLADLPGATRLTLAAGSADGATAIVAWAAPDAPTDADVRLQRLRALARLAPGVNHDGLNHLAGFGSFFGMLRGDDAFVAEYGISLIRSLEENAKNAPELLSAFAELARERRPAPAPTPLGPFLARAMLLTAHAMDVERSVSIPSDLPEILADPSRLHQALIAILVNALDALGGDRARGSLAISASATNDGDSPGVTLVVDDDAPVVPERDWGHLFDRVPPPGTSARAGLDLAVARRLLALDGGTLRYEPLPAGNRLTATLPVSAAQAARGTASTQARNPAPIGVATAMPEPPEPSASPAPATREVKPNGAGGRGAEPITILVCDDDETIRALMTRVLESSRYRVLPASSGREALAVLERDEVDVVMTDHKMDEMSGVDLYEAACERHPHLRDRFVLMSGDPGAEDLQGFAASTGLPVLGKPFTFTQLRDTIRGLTAG